MKKNKIYSYIERLSELFRVDARQAGLEYGLHPVQIEALHYLSICNKYSDTPMAVTEYLGQTKGTISQTLKILEKKGYLIKQADERDKRIIHLKISKEGRKIIDESIPTPMFIKAIDNLSETQINEISASLKILLSQILTSNKIKPYGACHSCFYNKKENDNTYYCQLIEKTLTFDETQLICKEYKSL